MLNKKWLNTIWLTLTPCHRLDSKRYNRWWKTSQQTKTCVFLLYLLIFHVEKEGHISKSWHVETLNLEVFPMGEKETVSLSICIQIQMWHILAALQHGMMKWASTTYATMVILQTVTSNLFTLWLPQYPQWVMICIVGTDEV